MTTHKHVLLGVTGSIAAVKSPEVVRLLVDRGFDVTCVMTKGAEEFVTCLSLATLSGKAVFGSEMFGAHAYTLPHIRLAEQARLFIIAPTSADFLARCAHGFCDDPVSLTFLTATAPTIMAPAMHPTMWENPATQANVKILRERGIHFVGPYIGPLADQTRGEGRMSEPAEIVDAAEKLLKK